MKRSSKEYFIKHLIKSVFVLFIFFSANAYCLSVSIPTTSVTGNYLISWTGGRTTVQVFELQGNSYVSRGTFTGATGSLNVSGKTPGTYKYYLQDCLMNYGGSTCTSSPIYTVVVSAGGLPNVASLAYPSNDKDGDFLVSWSAVIGATRYEVQQKTGSGAWQDVLSGTAQEYSVLINPGTYSFRVRACDVSSCSGWTEGISMSVTGRITPTNSRIVYLHTDALGSPAAETNEQGNENE